MREFGVGMVERKVVKGDVTFPTLLHDGLNGGWERAVVRVETTVSVQDAIGATATAVRECRRKAKGAGGAQPQALTGLGKAISQLTPGKEPEIESDLGEIRRGAKRRRAAASGGTSHKT